MLPLNTSAGNCSPAPSMLVITNVILLEEKFKTHPYMIKILL